MAVLNSIKETQKVFFFLLIFFFEECQFHNHVFLFHGLRVFSLCYFICINFLLPTHFVSSNVAVFCCTVMSHNSINEECANLYFAYSLRNVNYSGRDFSHFFLVSRGKC